MKKVLLILISLFVFAAISNAQEAPKQEQKQMTKEEKEKMKQKQEEELAAAFKEVGLTDDQIKQVREAQSEASEKNKALRNDAALSDDDKKSKMKEVNDVKNAKIKEIMGEEKYKQFNAIRKKQKEAASMNTPTPAGN
jgi:hypothetical protein